MEHSPGDLRDHMQMLNATTLIAFPKLLLIRASCRIPFIVDSKASTGNFARIARGISRMFHRQHEEHVLTSVYLEEWVSAYL